jgi:integrase
MTYKWISSKFKGVRFREHNTRKHGVTKDKYFAIRYQAQGKRHEEGLGWASEGWSAKKAFLLLSELKEAAKTGNGPTSLSERRKKAEIETKEAAVRNKQKNLDDLQYCNMFAQYEASVKSRLKKWESYRGRYKVHIQPFLGNTKIKDISTEEIKDFKKQLINKGLAPATIRHCLGIIRQSLNWAADSGIFLGKSPFSGIEGKKLIPSTINNARKRVLTKAEETILFPALLGKSKDIHDMALVSLYSGLRFSEIATMRWLAVDFKHNRVEVQGKGDKERTIPINQKVRQILWERKIPGTNLSALIFPSSKGTLRPQISKTYACVVKELSLNDGIEDRRYFVTFHTLRHTFATRLAEAGTPLTILRDLLGHRDLVMVSRYAKSTLEQAASRVNEL